MPVHKFSRELSGNDLGSLARPLTRALSAMSVPCGVLLAAATLLALLGASPRPLAKTQVLVSYDIVYVRVPRPGGDNQWPALPDIQRPLNYEPGSHLMRLHPDGSEEIFFSAGSDGAVLDPVVSFDAQWVYFAFMPDVRNRDGRMGIPFSGADIYKKNVNTGQVIRLTQQTWTPPSGAAPWSTDPLSPNPPGTNYVGYGMVNVGPCPLPGGKVMFVSNRDTYLPNKGSTSPNLRLYIMDDDGRNVEKVGHLNIGSALHPTVLMDGRVMFSSMESQGLRSSIAWGLWAIWPDGRKWEPLMSAFQGASAMHFQTQRTDGKILVTEYYIQNNAGFGAVLAFDPRPPFGAPPFGSPFLYDPSNPAVRRGLWDDLTPRYVNYQFSPPGIFSLTGFSHGEDGVAAPAPAGGYAGKATHPAAAPNNAVLLTYSPGPVNTQNGLHPPAPDAGIYLVPSGAEIDDPRQLVLVRNSPLYNEVQPRPLVPYSAIYGIGEPATLPYLPNDGTVHTALPTGTPFGLIGTASFYKRESAPGLGGHRAYPGVDAFGATVFLDSFNTLLNGESSNWASQGSDVGRYTNSEIHAVRIVALEGTADLGLGAQGGGFLGHAGSERLRILGEIPLRKAPGVLDPDGNPDTSFLAKIPADTPFTFQTLDKDGMVLNMAQTWHQLRPGEMRADCGGCHGHSKVGTDFFRTAAAQAGYVIPDLTGNTPYLSKDGSGNTIVRYANRHVLDVEYYRDIKPILERSCVSCHTGSSAAARLVLDDHAIADGVENTYNRLAADNDGNLGSRWGIPPIIEYGGHRLWRQTNASRYVRMFQSRRSLLMWKIMGRRLDGWTNADHPTESVPGDPATLPPGADPSDADIDYTGTIMPPSGTAPPLSEDEKMTFARWIDLGCPINLGGPNPNPQDYGGWFSDELKPTLTVSLPRAGPLTTPLTQIRIGMYDNYSGLNRSSLSVAANFPVNGLPPGTELGPYFSETAAGTYIWTLNLTSPIMSLADGRLTVRVKDVQGNYSVVDRGFSVAAGLSVTGINPNSGSTLGGTPVTIAGSGFLTGATVALGGVVATSVNVVNFGTITAMTGAHPAGIVDVVVTNPDSQSAMLTRGFAYEAPPVATAFYTLTPCRVVDTRLPDGPLGGPALVAGAGRSFAFAGQCGIPLTAKAIAVNATVTEPTTAGNLTLYPSGALLPLASTINYRSGQTRANNAILKLGPSGNAVVYCGQPQGATHMIIDVYGYFQ